ncbi:MAG TPA: MerR family transcriptional regulator [Pseudonocardiaceae bacterium]|nr:MerR family transcriptional regulator [Pseudonocardiaceae bacterium]
MTADAQWTIDELAQLVGEALAVDYSGQTNGRVRDVPDRRTIRWYTTIGLLDRPAAMRGRTALYGMRHLLQLVAVKRLQADGRTIAEVQQALLGADDATLDYLARVPDINPSPEPNRSPSPNPSPSPSPAPRRAPSPSQAPSHSAGPPPSLAPSPEPKRSSSPALRHGRAPNPESSTRPEPSSAPARFWAARPAVPKTPPGAEIVPSIRLADGVTLMLDRARPLTDADLAAIAEAATALLDVLHDRGLAAAPTEGGSPA